MVIQSIKTGQNHTVSPATWEKIKANGDSSKYKIVENEQPPQPDEAKQYESLLKRANKAYKEEKWAVAYKLFEQLKETKKTPYVTKKLTELSEKLGKNEQ